MNRTLTWTITTDQEGLTLEQFLRTRGCSHHVLTHLKHTGCGILLNGTWSYTSQKVSAGDTVTIHLIENEGSEQIVPVKMDLKIVYEDEDLMVIDKPADLPIHPSINNYENTLANGLLYYFTAQNIPFTYRCINRLDRDTSGLLIIAKHMLSGAILSRMSTNRRIHREYLAIVEGILPDSGTIHAPIARQEGSALMRCVDFERGELAVTHYRRIRCFAAPMMPAPGVSNAERNPFDPAESTAQSPSTLSLAAIRLETGRTHQIRVHMKYLGHPLIGDFLYNPDSLKLMSRQALHSHRLEFTHPITGEPLAFESELPEDMRRMISRQAQ
jgi:23S rRNA pseudouridine1911/1915/1917 synthase